MSCDSPGSPISPGSDRTTDSGVKKGRKKREVVSIACQHCKRSGRKCSVYRPCDRCVKRGYDDCTDCRPRRYGDPPPLARPTQPTFDRSSLPPIPQKPDNPILATPPQAFLSLGPPPPARPPRPSQPARTAYVYRPPPFNLAPPPPPDFLPPLVGPGTGRLYLLRPPPVEAVEAVSVVREEMWLDLGLAVPGKRFPLSDERSTV